jgi:hypothetical protein
MRTLAALLAVLPLSAVAQSAPDSESAPGTRTRIVLEARDCRRLVIRHRPSPDTAYEPGVDARGRPVVPADLLGGTELGLPEVIVIDVLIPLSEFLGEHAPPRIGHSEVRVGEVRVEGERLSFNGQPLGDPAGAAIAAECRRILAQRR